MENVVVFVILSFFAFLIIIYPAAKRDEAIRRKVKRGDPLTRIEELEVRDRPVYYGLKEIISRKIKQKDLLSEFEMETVLKSRVYFSLREYLYVVRDAKIPQAA